jgi:hypothetical protein
MWDTLRQLAPSAQDTDLTDRAFALVLSAILEQSLEIAILSHFVPLNETEQKDFFGPPDGTPVTLDVKIRLGHALGIYGSRSRAELTCIRHIRNVFAHTRTIVSFDDVEIVEACSQFKWIDLFWWGGVAGSKPTTPRALFFETVRHFFHYLALPPKNGKPLKYASYVVPDIYA